MSEAKDEVSYEAILLSTGEVYIYRNNFKEEANINDVFKFDVRINEHKQMVYNFSRFDFNPLKPKKDSPIRLNRTAIVFAWYIDPNADVIRALKDTEVKMNAQQAGIIVPGQ